MRRAAGAVLICLLAAACDRLGGGGAAKTFEQFADAWVRGRTDEALAFTQGNLKSRLEQKAVNRVMYFPIQTLKGTRYTVTSKEARGESVVLHVTQLVLIDPPGVESALRPAMAVSFPHTATLVKSGDAWKITAWDVGAMKEEKTP